MIMKKKTSKQTDNKPSLFPVQTRHKYLENMNEFVHLTNLWWQRLYHKEWLKHELKHELYHYNDYLCCIVATITPTHNAIITSTHRIIAVILSIHNHKGRQHRTLSPSRYRMRTPLSPSSFKSCPFILIGTHLHDASIQGTLSLERSLISPYPPPPWHCLPLRPLAFPLGMPLLCISSWLSSFLFSLAFASLAFYPSWHP